MTQTTTMLEPFAAEREGRVPDDSPSRKLARPTLLMGLGRLSRPFRSRLEQAGFRAREAADLQAAVKLASRLEPSLILVGSEGTPDPLGAIQELRIAQRDACILFLSPNSDPSPALRALEHGADDVVPPPHAVGAVLLRARVRSAQALGGNGRTPPLTSAPSRLVVDRSSRSILGRGAPTFLTGREFELLERLLRARGRVVPRRTILVDIWGEHQASDAVLDATVHRLRRKLELDPADPCILTTVRGIGYRLEAELIRLADSPAGP